MTTATILTPAVAPKAARPAGDVQELWFAVQARDWSSLAVLPSHPVGSASALARALVEVGKLVDPAVELLDAEGVALEDAPRMVSAIRAARNSDKRLVITVESVLYNQVSIPLVRAADAALLCVALGSDLDSARRTLELVGADHVLGCAAVREGGVP